jgi:hypothetical protein
MIARYEEDDRKRIQRVSPQIPPPEHGRQSRGTRPILCSGWVQNWAQWVPIRYLDGAGVPLRHELRRVETEPVPKNVLADTEQHPEEP